MMTKLQTTNARRVGPPPPPPPLKGSIAVSCQRGTVTVTMSLLDAAVLTAELSAFAPPATSQLAALLRALKVRK